MAEIINEHQESGPVVTEHVGEKPEHIAAINIISHSPIFYWWPVWFFGFIMAGITWAMGTKVHDPGTDFTATIHPNSILGLAYTLILFFVFLVTNMSLRGLISYMVIMFGLFIVVLFAWLGWWDDILFIIPDIHIYMNLGFYLTISILTFIAWSLSFFIFDRLDYWRIVPGQVTLEHLIGGGEESHDTSSLVFEQLHIDFFKHYLLGLGAGDLRMMVGGPNAKTFDIPNVLFQNYKVKKIQSLIKRKPD